MFEKKGKEEQLTAFSFLISILTEKHNNLDLIFPVSPIVQKII